MKNRYFKGFHRHCSALLVVAVVFIALNMYVILYLGAFQLRFTLPGVHRLPLHLSINSSELLIPVRQYERR
jgi:hypothetical protein